jgi:hypothetical protein
MHEYIQHLKEKQEKGELMIDVIMPAAYDWIVEQGWISADFYKEYIYSACVYRQEWLKKRPVTITEMQKRIKVHDQLGKSKEEETIRSNIAKKMVVYDFVQIMTDIKPKQLIKTTT